MENKTLLTVVALMLAGVVTVMLARGSDENYENVSNAAAAEARWEAAAAPLPSVADRGQVN